MSRPSFLAAALITLTVLIFGADSPNAGEPGVIIVPPVSVSGTPVTPGSPVPITNHSFEDAALAPNNFTAKSCNPADPICVQTATPVPGWSVVGTAGTWHPTAASYPGGTPDGSNVAYANGGSDAEIFQVLEAILAPKRSYFLEVDIGRRADGPFAGYKVQLWAGETLLAEDDNTLFPAPGTFATSRIGVAIGGDHPALGQNLEVVLISKGRQTNFDDVMLTSAPFAPAVKVPFYVELDSDITVLVAKNGPLELAASCHFTDGARATSLTFRSTQPGWFGTTAGGPLEPDDSVVVASTVVSTGPAFTNDIDGTIAASPDGASIAVDRESTGVGINIFGHDCIAIGTAVLISAP